MDKRILAGLFGCILSATASASLIFDSTRLLSAQGFGAAPRDLTIQEVGPMQNGVESGCVGVNAMGGIVIGPAAPRCSQDAAFMGNLVISVGGDEPQPDVDGNKFGIPTLASLGITNASQIGILFNATEPGADSANVTDITLNFFSGAGGNFSFITSIDGQQNFPSTNPGNGVAGFVFVVDAAQQDFLNTLIFNQPTFNGSVIRLSLNSTIADVADGGPESFRIVNLGTAPVCVPSPTVSCGPQQIPEPGILALLGIALLGGLATIRRRSERS